MPCVPEETTDPAPEDHAAIGRALCAFGALEHAIMCGLIALCPDVGSDARLARWLRQATGQGFSGRSRMFVARYRDVHGVDAWILDFERAIGTTIALRNPMAHGLWRRGPEGELFCLGFARADMGGDIPATVRSFERAELQDIADEILGRADGIAARFAPEPPAPEAAPARAKGR